jgi:hypothetical protein
MAGYYSSTDSRRKVRGTSMRSLRVEIFAPPGADPCDPRAGILFVPAADMWLVHGAGGGRAARPLGERALDERLTPLVGETAVYHWRDVVKRHWPDHLDWFLGWVKGADAPAGVRVVTADEAARAGRAWDYVAFCHQLKIAPSQTYRQWIADLKDADPRWLGWFYGGDPPPDVFVVGEKLVSLRRESSKDAICLSAGVQRDNLWDWEQDDVLRRVLAGAIAHAARAGIKDDRPDQPRDWCEECSQVPPKVKERIWRYAWAARLYARLEKAGLSGPHYTNLLREAERKGVQDHLARYLNRVEPYGPHQAKKCGLVAPCFFITSENMRAFRELANAAWRDEGITGLQSLPQFDAWFRRWATPEAKGRKRGAAAPAGSKLDPHEAHPVHVTNPVLRVEIVNSGADTGPRPSDNGEPVVPPAAAGTGADGGKRRRPQLARPRWDAAARTLYLGDQVCKTYRQKPGHQETILQTFQEDDWPSRIDDPLSGSGDENPEQRLRNAVRNLNLGQPLIRFACDGRKGILWEPVPQG